jgi:signal recognition particle receptor subunit beta
VALIDSDAGEIVIRLVYDGPPEAGKTTSLRALAGSLAQTAYTPAEDAGGRTLWFDWMEYVGGRFEGCQIRCQIVSVPGQRTLSARRRRIIESADVVVFVGDSAMRHVPETLAYLFELRDMLAGETEVPIGVILQANKRDLADAIPLDDLRARLAEAGWPIGVVESIAAEGTGIREAFVYAVRLALDRVRELMNRQTLPTSSTGPRTPDELLEALRFGERTQHVPAPRIIESGPGSVAAELFREVLSHEHEVPRDLRSVAMMNMSGAPRPPDAEVPSGAIWPPVEGRMILAELAQLELTPRKLSTGDWAAGLGTGWRVLSSRDASFGSLDQGRAALIQWARLHASTNGAVSPSRCIVLADSGVRGWRLWQILRAEPSLREAVEAALRQPSEAMLARLSQLAQLLLEADDKLARLFVPLPCTLDTIGAWSGNPVYIGLMPDAGTPLVSPRTRLEPATFLRHHLEPIIAAELHDRRLDFDQVLARLTGKLTHDLVIPRTLAG